ncbi:hypothetical protein LMH87_001265 [Akanthomyces muscarius]|uniref:2-deoxyglucose-6-phosphate phosphatase n=1 Tax=Akanthomyces muscarius TaxID=2231603 RepID=A0A9W8UPL3_AKAMU|nr:hypothetical protein LMH87_001265 [Akanthomyces muscarius]KAJ4156051.1 hypothetical protein LMH87_001265 [Akanthomyces muscarius]
MSRGSYPPVPRSTSAKILDFSYDCTTAFGGSAFRALLSDMDGTLIDSTDAVVQHWQRIGKELGMDPSVILQTAHGRRTVDTLKIISAVGTA